MEKKLNRSREDRMLGGVCGGLGEFLGIDPNLIRLAFFLLMFGGGVGFWVYLVLWILIPEEGVEAGDFKERFQMVGDDFVKAFNRPHPKSGLIIGGGLVILGSVWLLEALGIPWLWWFDFDYLWPAVLILAGVVMIIRWRQ
jgi:phage shock protein C